MNLYFENRFGERRLIATPETKVETMKTISDFLAEHHFKSYYTRSWQHNNEIWYDVGSHSEFFILAEE